MAAWAPIPIARGTLWQAAIERPYRFESPCAGEEFALWLAIGSEGVASDEQSELSEAFVRQGCRYAVCWGYDCSSWDDSIDMVSVMDEVNGRPGPLVMTTWHEHESLNDVASFFAHCAAQSDWAPTRYVALQIGGGADLGQQMRQALVREFSESSR